MWCNIYPCWLTYGVSKGRKHQKHTNGLITVKWSVKTKKKETSELWTAVTSLSLLRTVLPPRGCDPSASILALPAPTSASVIRLSCTPAWYTSAAQLVMKDNKATKNGVRTALERALQHRYPNPLDASATVELSGWSVKSHFTATLSNKMQSCRQTFMKEIKNKTVWGWGGAT